MKDLSMLTAVTNVEYSLFRRNDKYIIYKGNNRNIHISESDVCKLLVNNFVWVGHTHVGGGKRSLIPSSGDIDVLRKFHQKRSVIYNGAGEFYIMYDEKI